MENNLRVGIVGLGSMGKNHLRVYSELPNIHVVGIYDTNEENALEVSRIFGVKVYKSYEELLQNIDAVSIATPTIFHEEHARLAADYGVHVLLEKPIAREIEEAKRLIDYFQEKQLVLQIGHIERFNPVIPVLKSILDDEEIVSLDFRRLSPYDNRIFDVDVIHDLMIHDLDILAYLVGSDIRHVSAQAIDLYSRGFADYSQALISFNNNIVASLTASRITETKIRTLQVHTKKAFIDVDYLNKSIVIIRKTQYSNPTTKALTYKQESLQEKIYIPIKEPLKEELKHFIESVKNGEKPLVDGEQGLNALQLVELVRQSIRS